MPAAPDPHAAEPTRLLEADYVIVGAGAVGMAFADSLLSESAHDMIVVDRRHQPGGHWLDSYPFIRLHGPSAHYGVNSRALGDDTVDQTGSNRGLMQQASGAEICAYFDRVMQDRLLPSGRVTYLPMTEVVRGGDARSRVDGRRFQLRARRKWVDATAADTQVPATHPPRFRIAAGVRWTTPNDLVMPSRAASRHVIVGGGKTGIDVALWLLGQGVEPDAITWIRPREAWLLNRALIQPSDHGLLATLNASAAEMEAAAAAGSIAELFERLERGELLRRIDRAVTPTMFRCAIVSDAELAQLRRIRRVVRMGHVVAIEPDRIVLTQGEIGTSPDTLHVHCSAAGLPRRRDEPIFQCGRIVLQYVRRCSPCFSAALIARLEAALTDDETRNALSEPVAPPERPLDWLRIHLSSARNQRQWSRSPELRGWLPRARLDPLAGAIERALGGADAPAVRAAVERYRRALPGGLERLAQLLASVDEVEGEPA